MSGEIMNSKSIKELLSGVKVKWERLEEIFDIIAGGDVPKKALSNKKTEEYNIPILSNGISDKALYGWTNKAKIFKPSLTISARGTIGWTSYQDKPFFPIVRLLVLTPKVNLNLKYAYYFMKTIENNYKVSKNSIPQLTKPMIKNIKIPIPPLEVQKKIVQILDSFTELTTELTTELIARKKQYSYYRDKLLTFKDNEVEWKRLGEVAIIGTGNRNTNEAVENGKYPFFVRSQIPKKIDNFEYDETAIITAGDGVGVGKVFHYINGKYALHQRAYRIVVKNEELLLSKYLFYFFINNFYQYILKTSVHSSVSSLRKPMFEKFQIPIPPIEKQKEIVAILDKFDTLTNSISEGLPREIELRKKQYEYYRDKLLNFEYQEKKKKLQKLKKHQDLDFLEIGVDDGVKIK
jgi:type I restriction enzyme S subunit